MKRGLQTCHRLLDMKLVTNRLIVTFAGLFLFILILEISLRCVGFFYSTLSETDPKDQFSDANKVTILCIGDSVTFGIGAPRSLSYPAQLQTSLNKAEGTVKYSVINRGRPGQNSAQLLLRLEGYLQQFQPDIVTILIGAQNQANFFGYREYKQNLNQVEGDIHLLLIEWLDKFRVYKFFRLLLTKTSKVETVYEPARFSTLSSEELDTIDMPGEYTQELFLYTQREKMAQFTPACVQAFEHKLKGEYEEALTLLQPLADSKTAESECYLIAGAMYRDQKQSTKAIEWFKKGINRDPGQFANYEGIGDSYRDQNNLNEALLWYKLGFKNAREETLHKLCYVGINVAFEDTGDNTGAIEFFKNESQRSLKKSLHLHALAQDYLNMFENSSIDNEVHKWIVADLIKILDLCRKYEARPIIQNYPVAPLVNYIYRKFAEQHDLPLVDHQSTFQKHIRGNTLNGDYFVPDGHPNAMGYQLMTENIIRILHTLEKNGPGNQLSVPELKNSTKLPKTTKSIDH